MLKWRYIALVFIAALLTGCGGTTLPENPLNEYKRAYKDKLAYTIILHDMDLQGEQYLHKYRIFEVTKDNKVNIENTDWKKVDDYFFLLHQDDLGMSILSKRADGRYNNLVTPPGFSTFVGQPTFGDWEAGPDGNVYWKFKSEYAYLDKELELDGLKMFKSEYDTYQEKYAYNRPYYGQKVHKDSTRYGTRSSHWVHYRPIFFLRYTSTRSFYKPISSSSSGGNRGGGGFGK